MEYNREAQRSRSFLKADIEMNGSALSCIVKNLSDTGARIIVSDSVVLPEIFRLRLPKTDRWLNVTVKWRRGEFVGLQFATAASSEPGGSPQSSAERIRHLEAEASRLRRMLEELRADPTKLHQILDQAA